jgi:hypothetical protein
VVTPAGLPCFSTWSAHRTWEAVAVVQENLRVPSGSTLSKNQLYIDAMLCRYWRERFAADSGPLYIWADSSPQAGANWLLSMVLSIRSDQLLETAKAARYLATTAGIIETEGIIEDFEDCLRQRSKAGRTVADNMHVHSQIPMALGSGAEGLDHKLRCIVQKTFAETSSKRECRQFFQRVRGCCVDMGVEFGISDATGVDAIDLMPGWIRAAVEDEEEGPGPDFLGLPGQQFMMPLCVLSAGSCHIVNNVQKDVDKHLPGWAKWLPGYKGIAYLLHKVPRSTTARLREFQLLGSAPFPQPLLCRSGLSLLEAHRRGGDSCVALPEERELQARNRAGRERCSEYL